MFGLTPSATRAGHWKHSGSTYVRRIYPQVARQADTHLHHDHMRADQQQMKGWVGMMSGPSGALSGRTSMDGHPHSLSNGEERLAGHAHAPLVGSIHRRTNTASSDHAADAASISSVRWLPASPPLPEHSAVLCTCVGSMYASRTFTQPTSIVAVSRISLLQMQTDMGMLSGQPCC